MGVYRIHPVMEYYRSDGVRITHDPYHPDMAKKYGQPGETDSEGFDPYADSVGPGIYGGIIKRDEHGEVVIGAQCTITIILTVALLPYSAPSSTTVPHSATSSTTGMVK